jgi:type I restriction enzyme S subunit
MKAGWKTVKLNDVCDIVKGRKPNLRTTPNKGDLPYLVARYIRGLEDPEYGSPVEKGVVTLTEADTVIICDGSNSGEIFTGLNGIMSSTMGKVVKKTEIYDPYLRHFLSSTFELFNGTKTGSAIPHLDKDAFRKLEIPLPPLAEQKRIVALLDEAFAGIDEAKANAEANQSKSDGLYKSYLQSVFRERGSEWLDVKLDEVCGFQNGFAFKSNTFRPSGTPVIRISNIQDGIIDTENRLVFVNPKDYRENLDRYRVVEGDLLIAMSGATTGKIGFNTESREFYLNQRVGKFEPGKKLNKRFLYHFLSTKVEENLSISAGAAQPNLSTEQIKGLVLPLPPIEEQARIVASIEALLAEIRQLDSLYAEKQLALAGLKNSLLIQAFAGELTA